MAHLWYMPMIVVAYLMLPLILFLKNRIDGKAFYLVFAGLVSLSFTYDYATYLTYICIGYIYFDLKVRNLEPRKLLVLFFISLILISYVVGIQVYDYNHGIMHNIWYTEKPLIYATTALFPCFALLNKYQHKVITELSRSAFAIYLLHFPCMLLLSTPIKRLEFGCATTSILLFICTFVIAYGVFRLLTFNQTVAKRLFLYK